MYRSTSQAEVIGNRVFPLVTIPRSNRGPAILTMNAIMATVDSMVNAIVSIFSSSPFWPSQFHLLFCGGR